SAKLSDRANVLNALHHLKKAVIENPELNSVHSILARCHFALDEFHEAAKSYERVLAQPGLEPNERAISLRSAALCYEHAGEIEQAIRSFEKLSKEFPPESAVYLRIAELHTKKVPANLNAIADAVHAACELDSTQDKDWRLSTIVMQGGLLEDAERHDL